MSNSLLQRLKQLHVEAPVEEEEDLNQFSVQQLRDMKIDFGNSHKGKTYHQMWTDHQSWAQWMLSHYGQSKKPAHRRVIHYFSLEIERCELTGQAVPLTDAPPKPKMTAGIRPKPKAKSHAAPAPSSKPSGKTEWEEEWELQGLEMDPEDLIALQEENQNPEIVQLNDRMSQMEEMLSQIVQHLQKPA